MKNINESLAKFSNFIGAAFTYGSVGLVFGLIVFFVAFSSPNPLVLGVSILLVYGSINALGLAVVGAFLRQTAKVIVEGLAGNLAEGDSAADLSFTSEALTNAQDARASELSMMQRVQWEENGRPNLSDWDGSIKFTTWLKAQSDRRQG